jgi:hypothetical protein
MRAAAQDAAAAWLAVAPPLAVGARWPDGTLAGTRLMAVDHDGLLRSPAQRTAWDRAALSAGEWTDAAALRGATGIHASWPAIGGVELPGEVRALVHATRSAGLRLRLGLDRAIAYVAGYGRCVTGDLGWRAERVLLLRVVCAPQMLERIRARYPEIDCVARSRSSE